MLKEKDLLRYSRQIELEGFGVKGQENLKQAKVLIVGVGGLGSIASLLLVASGVGVIGIMDCDEVSLTNLHRQILYKESQIGEEKVEKAKENLREVNSDCKIICYNEFLSKENEGEDRLPPPSRYGRKPKDLRPILPLQAIQSAQHTTWSV